MNLDEIKLKYTTSEQQVSEKAQIAIDNNNKKIQSVERPTALY